MSSSLLLLLLFLYLVGHSIKTTTTRQNYWFSMHIYIHIYKLSLSILSNGRIWECICCCCCCLFHFSCINCFFLHYCCCYILPVSGIAPVIRFASSPRTLAITRWGEFEPPKMAPPNFENRAESPPLAPSDEEATVLFYGKSIARAQIRRENFSVIKLLFLIFLFW